MEKLRKVKVFSRVYVGNYQYEKKENGEALFHAWGCYFEEFEAGPVNYTVAVIEREDGTIETVNPEEIQFIE